MLIGIDDAGRGPVLGNMILGGVLIEKEDEKILKELGAKDSKLLVHTERIRLAELIKKQVIAYEVIPASPAEIDEAIFSGANLNTLEARKMAAIINNLNNKKKEITVIVDCPSVNTEVWRKKLLTFIEHPSNLTILCEHKADFNHPVVSAASILAKVVREEDVVKLQNMYGDIGSGYPSDPKTQIFLKERGKELANTGIFRKSWATWKAIFPTEANSRAKSKQKNLSEF